MLPSIVERHLSTSSELRSPVPVLTHTIMLICIITISVVSTCFEQDTLLLGVTFVNNCTECTELDQIKR